MLLQIFRRNFYSNASCFSLLLLYLGNSQVSVYMTIGPTLVPDFNCVSIPVKHARVLGWHTRHGHLQARYLTRGH